MTERPRAPRPRIVILTPVYNEQETLGRYRDTLSKTLFTRSDCEFQVLFIDDGSQDCSWPIIQQICAEDPHFRAIRLSRNFGPHVALGAGFAQADGDAVATLACDLQDPPEVILQFIEKWRTGSQVVWGHRRSRRDGAWRAVTSHIFRRLIGRFAMPRDSKFTTGSFFLVDREVARCVRQFHEHNRITFALVAWTGFDQAVVEYDRQERQAGTSGWTLAKMLKSTYDTFIGFSLVPVWLITIAGLLLFLVALGLAAYVMHSWLTGNPRPGWTSLMLTQAVFFSVQFLLIGLVGEYLHRIHAEVVRRPLYFISDRAGVGEEANP